MSKNKNSKRGPGRPEVFGTKWREVNKRQMWKNKSNAEIAKFVGCTQAAVCNKRKDLRVADILAGGDGSKFLAKDGVKFRRAEAKAPKAKAPKAKGKDSPVAAE